MSVQACTGLGHLDRVLVRLPLLLLVGVFSRVVCALANSLWDSSLFTDRVVARRRGAGNSKAAGVTALQLCSC